MIRTEYVYFVLTEEGMECMSSTPYDALTSYLAAGAGRADEYDWLNDVLSGDSEINSIVQMTREEYKEWLKTAIEV